jgi:hypothetical protein
MVLTYFTTCSKEDENLPILQDAINYLQIRYDLEVKAKTTTRFNTKGIDLERYTHEQNEASEHLDWSIMEKPGAMTLSARLPTHDLWREVVASATYLIMNALVPTKLFMIMLC